MFNLEGRSVLATGGTRGIGGQVLPESPDAVGR